MAEHGRGYERNVEVGIQDVASDGMDDVAVHFDGASDQADDY
jgi:hypothetical protein